MTPNIILPKSERKSLKILIFRIEFNFFVISLSQAVLELREGGNPPLKNHPP